MLSILFFVLTLGAVGQSGFIYEPVSLPVIYEVEAESFPLSWQNEAIQPYGEALDSIEYARTQVILERALGKYPNQVLSDNLDQVYVLKVLSFYGEEFGGTNSSDAVYIANDGFVRGYTDDYVESTFHHEFSSILYRNFPDEFDEQAWFAANGRNFRYGSGGVAALKSEEDGQDMMPRYLRQGVLHQYAGSSLENDINSYAENLFTGNEEFWLAVEKYPRVKRKAELMISFYENINSDLNYAFFERLRRSTD